MMKRKWIEMVVIFLAFTFASMNLAAHGKADKAGTDGWAVPKEASERKNPTAMTPDSVDRGKDLYQKYCIFCHGASGRGDGPTAAGLSTKPSDLVEDAAHHSDGNLAWKIENGLAPMPAWKGTLTESQIWDVVNYIKSLAKATKK